MWGGLWAGGEEEKPGGREARWDGAAGGECICPFPGPGAGAAGAGQGKMGGLLHVVSFPPVSPPAPCRGSSLLSGWADVWVLVILFITISDIDIEKHKHVCAPSLLNSQEVSSLSAPPGKGQTFTSIPEALLVAEGVLVLVFYDQKTSAVIMKKKKC